MAPTPRKYQGFTANERSVAGAGTTIASPLIFVAPEDMTIVGVHVELALSMESLEPTLGYEHNNIGGIARLVIYKAAADTETLVPSGDWDAQADQTLNDTSDVGDTWAMTPFALSSSGTNTTPGHGGNVHLMLSPKTKRKLRREDQVQVQLYYTNSGDDTGTIQEIVTGTIFCLT